MFSFSELILGVNLYHLPLWTAILIACRLSMEVIIIMLIGHRNMSTVTRSRPEKRAIQRLVLILCRMTNKSP